MCGLISIIKKCSKKLNKPVEQNVLMNKKCHGPPLDGRYIYHSCHSGFSQWEVRPRPAGPPGRAPESLLEEITESFGRFQKLCGASRLVWGGCRRFWRGSGEVYALFIAFRPCSRQPSALHFGAYGFVIMAKYCF